MSGRVRVDPGKWCRQCGSYGAYLVGLDYSMCESCRFEDCGGSARYDAPATRDSHDELIDAYTDLLNKAMKEKDRDNRHKKPLADEEDYDLFVGSRKEADEVEREFWRADRLRSKPYAVALELADYNLYNAARLRRLGALG